MPEESLAEFYYNALGMWYTVLLTLSAAVSFAMALAVVIKGKGPTVGPALVLSVLMPLLVGALSFVESLIWSNLLIGYSKTMPSPVELGTVWSSALVSLHVGVILAIPTFLVAVFGATFRALKNQP